MSFLNQVVLLLLEGAESGCIHLSDRIYVMSTSQLSVDLHDELSLPLQLFTFIDIFLLEVAACFIGSFGRLYLVHTRSNDLIFQKNALLELLTGLCKSFFSLAIVAFVVSALFVKLKL